MNSGLVGWHDDDDYDDRTTAIKSSYYCLLLLLGREKMVCGLLFLDFLLLLLAGRQFLPFPFLYSNCSSI